MIHKYQENDVLLAQIGFIAVVFFAIIKTLQKYERRSDIIF